MSSYLLPTKPQNLRNSELTVLIKYLSTFLSAPYYLCGSQWLLNLWETWTNQYYISVLMPLIQQPYVQIFSPESQKSVNKNDIIRHKYRLLTFYTPSITPFPSRRHFYPSYKKCEPTPCTLHSNGALPVTSHMLPWQQIHLEIAPHFDLQLAKDTIMDYSH